MPASRPDTRPPRTRWVALIVAVVVLALASAFFVPRIVDEHMFALTSPSTTTPVPQQEPASIGTLDDDDGYIATGESISPFADDLPSISGLDPALRDAMQAAATAAIADGFEFVITSGWRSERYQQFLFDEAVRNYASVEEARKWVSTPDTSHHVTGDAVDVGFTDANSWLSQHGADYGLCQMYANEMWHFELATTPGGECPPQRTDPS